MRKSEVWLINLDPSLGAEIQKKRPAIIINEDAIGILPLRVIVPLTEWKDRYEIAAWMVCIPPDPTNGLKKTSCADAFQIHSVSQTRFISRLGRISSSQLQEVLNAVKLVIGV